MKETIMCKIDGCNREAMYKSAKLCQMHYFRYMRYKTFELTQTRKYRLENPAGYQKVYVGKHELKTHGGYIYEHRLVYYNKFKKVDKCCLCGNNITWDSCHVDHIDNNVKNNNIENLRALCRPCNTYRGHNQYTCAKIFLTHDGKTFTYCAWARHPDVNVTSSTIRRRIKLGWSTFDALFGKKKTHINCKTKKYIRKYDKVRNIIFT